MDKKTDRIRRLVGDVMDGQLRYVDCFVGEDIGIFMPVGGACFFALTPMHTHPSYMFILPFDDRTSVSVGGKVLTAQPGKVSAYSPDVPHHELPSDRPPRYAAVMVDKSFFDLQLSSYAEWGGITFRGESFNAPRGFMAMLKRFMVEADNRVPGCDEVLRAIGVELCHSLIRAMLGLHHGVDRVSTRMEIERAVEFIYTNIAERITVDDLARAARMSVSHFARVFKDEVGATPMAYLEQARMDRVKKLMAAGDKNITEMAMECGFSSPGYLSGRFSKHFGMSPSAYMKRLKGRDS
jgi:AraC family transcriptional regulator